MNHDKFQKIYELEDEGKPKEAFELLSSLADDGYGHALLEMANRFLSPDSYVKEIYPINANEELSKSYALKAVEALKKEAASGNGESMRMLAYTCLGLHVPFYEKDIEAGERWLLQAYKAGCHFVANDLSTFYQYSDLEKARFWYKEADKHNCRVIYNESCET